MSKASSSASRAARASTATSCLSIEPQEPGKGFEFVDAIKGGVVPREFIPAVRKGVEDTLPNGVLAGYPVVDVKVTLTFGSYHEVDSNENAFKMAASMGFKDGCRKATPVILEPMMAVEVETPEDYAGNVMGDLSSRRGMVQGMDDIPGGGKIIKAEVPLSEMFGYSTTLRSMSQGRATYTMEFKHYSEAPKNVADAIITSRGNYHRSGYSGPLKQPPRIRPFCQAVGRRTAAVCKTRQRPGKAASVVAAGSTE